MKIINISIFLFISLFVSYSSLSAAKIMGLLEPFATTTIKSQITGEIEDIYVNIGDKIKRKQNIIQINNADYLLEYKMALEKERLSSLNHDFLKKEFNRYKSLLETKTITPQLYDSYENNYKNSIFQKKISQIYTNQARRQLDKTKIKVPYKSSISYKYVEVGDYVNIGDSLVEIVDNTRLKAVFHILQEDYFNYRPGMTVVLNIPDLNHLNHKGKILSIAPKIIGTDPGYRMEVLLNNEKNLLEAGFDVELLTQSQKELNHE